MTRNHCFRQSIQALGVRGRVVVSDDSAHWYSCETIQQRKDCLPDSTINVVELHTDPIRARRLQSLPEIRVRSERWC